MVYYKCCTNRGGSGALYLQSAIARVLSDLGLFLYSQPIVSGVEIRVLRNRSDVNHVRSGMKQH